MRINILIFISIIAGIEIGGQLIALVKNGRFLFSPGEVHKRDQLFQPHPYLSVALRKNVSVGSENDIQYVSVSTTELGTRWTGADLEDTTAIRIVCIGGSTTFCTGVSDQDSWPAILQQKLGKRYAVINYGVPAYKTVEAIVQLALYVTELSPDMVIFYGGGNDFYNYHMENTYPDYFYHGEHLMPMALLGRSKYETCSDIIQRNSGFFYILNNVRERIYSEELPVRHAYPDNVVDSLYARNLKTILALTSSMSARELVIGQVLNPFIEFEETPWSMRLERELIIPYMDRMNEISKNICSNDSSCEYLDFKNDIPWKPGHFWDEMHFTREGNELFAIGVEEYVRRKTEIDSEAIAETERKNQ